MARKPWARDPGLGGDRDIAYHKPFREGRDDAELAPANEASGLAAQVTLVVLVVLLGCANNIAKQITAKTLERFNYMLGLVSATSYVVLYWGILAGMLAAGLLPDVGTQLRWVWRGWRGCLRSWSSGSSPPGLKLFVAAAAGDALGDVFGYLCTPYVAGPVHALLVQCTTVFTVLLSLLILQRRYSLLQCCALVAVIGATTLGVLPNLRKTGANGTDPLMAAILGGSCVFNAFAFVMKELAFGSYKEWVTSQNRKADTVEDDPSLNIFVANTAESTLQLPITLLLVPLAVATGQTHGDPLALYLSEGLACLGGGGSASCMHAPVCTLVYVVFNISWNICILLSVKWNGALATFVALKAIMPTSAVLFAYVDWPLLGRTPLKPITWVSLSGVLPAIAVFTWASHQQSKRAEVGQATCFWPLCADEDEDDREENDSSSESLLE